MESCTVGWHGDTALSRGNSKRKCSLTEKSQLRVFKKTRGNCVTEQSE